MRYRIKKEKSNDLKDGRTSRYIGERIGKRGEMISSIMTGYLSCNKSTALLLVHLRRNEKLQNLTDEEQILYYFDEEE